MLRRILIWLAALPLLYVLAAVLGGLVMVPQAETTTLQARLTRVLLVSGPIHYDILLPLKRDQNDVRDRFDFLRDHDMPLDNPRAEWLLVGWGARDFYTTAGTYRDVTARAVWRGLTGDRSVMRVDVLGHLRNNLAVRELWLNPPEYAALLTAIRASFAEQPDGQPLVLPEPGFSDSDRFFAAKGQFHLFNTCNVWVGRVIRAAGQRFGVWTPTPFAVTLSHWRFHTP